MRTFDVILCKFERVPKGVVYVALRREVQNDINVFTCKNMIQQVHRTQIAPDELDAEEMSDTFDVLQAAIVELIEDDYLRTSVRDI